MKQKEFDRIVKELERGKKELTRNGISFVLSGRTKDGKQKWYSTNCEDEKCKA